MTALLYTPSVVRASVLSLRITYVRANFTNLQQLYSARRGAKMQDQKMYRTSQNLENEGPRRK